MSKQLLMAWRGIMAADGQLPGQQQEVQAGRQQEAVPGIRRRCCATQRLVPQDWGDVTGAV